MDKLWSPWREEYILSLKDISKGECIFCYLGRQNPSSENLVLYKGENIYVVMNRFPYNNGHLLIIPYRHLGDITNLNLEEKTEMMDLLVQSARMIKKSFSPHGFNIGMNLGNISGAGIADHVHFHIVPRWGGDTNFMPVLGKTKVISQSLIKGWKLLKKEFDKI